jgi:hypothetical protein
LKVFGKIFGKKRRLEKKIHTEELHNLYYSPDIIRTIKSWRMRWVGHVLCTGEVTDACRILVRKPEGERLLE